MRRLVLVTSRVEMRAIIVVVVLVAVTGAVAVATMARLQTGGLLATLSGASLLLVVGALVTSGRDPVQLALVLLAVGLPFGSVELAGPLRLIDLLLLLVAAAVVAAHGTDGTLRDCAHPVLWWASMAVVVALASTVHRGLGSGMPWVARTLLAAVVIAALIGQTRVRGRSLLGLLRLLSIALTGAAVHGIAVASELTARFGGAAVDGRAEGTFSQPNLFAAAMAVGVVLALGCSVVGTERVWRAVHLLGAALCGAALLLSLSRGAWLSLVVALLALAWWLPRVRRTLSTGLLVGAMLTGLGVGAFGIGGDLGALVVDRLESTVQGRIGPEDRRPDIWREAARQFTAEPALGQGPGRFADESADRRTGSGRGQALHAHNTVLHVAAEVGIAGLLALVGGTSTVALAGIRSVCVDGREPDPVVPIAGAALVTLATQGLVDHPAINPAIFVLIGLLAGLVVAGSVSPVSPASTSGSPMPLR